MHKKEYGVLGLGKFGTAVAKTLTENGNSVIAVDMDPDAVDEIADIVTAIGNHDEGTGVAVNPVAAALILADKSDVRRSRVRNTDPTTFDIHDRVNFSVVSSSLDINTKDKTVRLTLKIDTASAPIMDYFEIFLARMLLCRRAAEKLGLKK